MTGLEMILAEDEWVRSALYCIQMREWKDNNTFPGIDDLMIERGEMMKDGSLLVLQLYCTGCGGELDGERITIPDAIPEFGETVYTWLQCQDCGAYLSGNDAEGILEALQAGLLT